MSRKPVPDIKVIIITLLAFAVASIAYYNIALKPKPKEPEIKNIFTDKILTDIQTHSPPTQIAEKIQEQVPETPTITYTSYATPDIDSTFKAYMDYRTITDRTSRQYKYITENAWTDTEGFMRSTADEGVESDYYLVALASYYGTEIGAKYRITTDKGNVFYAVLADCKDDKHTNSTNQYTVVGTNNVVEFLVDTPNLNKKVRRMGSANAYEPLSGNIISIEKITMNT